MARCVDVNKARLIYEKAEKQEFLNYLLNIEINQTVSSLIKEANDKYGVTKTFLAKLLGKSNSTLTLWEQTNSNVETVYWVVLGIKTKYNYNRRLRLECDSEDYE